MSSKPASSAADAAKQGALLDADLSEPPHGEENVTQIIQDKVRNSKANTSQPKGWPHFVAGGIGGMCGAIVTSPLDVVKTRLQSDMYVTKAHVQQHSRRGVLAGVSRLAYHFVETGHLLKEISAKEGPRALFKGLGPTLVGVVPARSINFYSYGNGKLLIAEHLNGGKETSAVHLSAATLAGIITATATNPIWVVKTRLQLQHHEAQKAEQVARKAAIRSSESVKGVSFSGKPSFSTMAFPRFQQQTYSSHFFRASPPPPRPSINSFSMTLKIVREEGMPGLYKGISASYLGVAEGTIQWTLYEQFKRMSQPRETDSEFTRKARGWVGTVGAAGTAKMIASLITYPHEVLRTRMRQAPPPGQMQKYNGLIQTFKLVLQEEGASALYGGLSAHLLRVVPNAAIMFVVYETMLGVSQRS